LAFFDHNILIITLVFEKNANFFAENCQKSQKVVIITSAPEEQSGFIEIEHMYLVSNIFW
jgi:hypothetical protein